MAEIFTLKSEPEPNQKPNGLTIIVSGVAGTGKGTLGRELASTFGIDYFSVGDFVRDWMMQQRAAATTTDEAALLDFQSQHNEDQTMYPDRYTAELSAQKRALLIDSHLFRIVQGRFSQPGFFPFSLGIYLHGVPTVCAERIHHRMVEANEPVVLRVEDLVKKNLDRTGNNVYRFNRDYDLAIPPADNYPATVEFFSRHNDVVIDTTHLTPDQVANTALHDMENLAAENSLFAKTLAQFTNLS
ncbi:MAG: AAA family ATPase [Candidatus Chisholmbacteria bacterium]|nr:AAA family ATPase [Candidatus Chisholmbacteria bacterium]